MASVPGSNGGGRRPNPEYLRVVDKAHAHRYKDEPKPVEDKPVAPEYLDQREREVFEDFVKRVEEIGIASATDLDVIILYAKNQCELEYLEQFLRENGHTYEANSQWGIQFKKRPECEIYNQCKNLKLRILVEFGLTPSARARVKVKPKPKTETKNPFAALDDAQNDK